MPTYDEPERLRAALKSLSRQAYAVDKVEIIVIDDASPTLDEEALYAAIAPFALKLIRNPANLGRARARNVGLLQAQGDIVIFLDSDMTVEGNFLQVHAQGHQRHPRDILIGNILWGSEIPINALTRYIESRGVHRTREDEVHFKCFVTGNSSLRREFLFEVGLFDKDFTAYGGEDLELAYRLNRAGARFRYLEQAVSYHNHIRPLDQLCQLMHTYGYRSIPVLLDKHPGLTGILRLDFLREPLLAPRRLLLQLALRPLFYQPIFWLTRRAMRCRVPDLFFDYLLWYNRTRGYLDSPHSSC
jgi:GT2 family glycosyltransferase